MPKAPISKKSQNDSFEELDFSNFISESAGLDDGVVLDMMTCLTEAHHHQQQTALELTKLVLEKVSSSEKMNEKEIFATFKRAIQTVSEVSPIQELFKKMTE